MFIALQGFRRRVCRCFPSRKAFVHHFNDALREKFRPRQLTDIFAIPEDRKTAARLVDFGHSRLM